MKRRGLGTRAKLAARLKKYGEADEVIASLPAPARADLMYSPVTDIGLATAKRLGEKLRYALRISGGPYIGPKRVWIVGSARREKEGTKDLDMLVVLPNRAKRSAHPHLAMLGLKNNASARGIRLVHSYASGPRRRSFMVKSGGKHYKVDFFLAYDSELPYALFHHTGSSKYNIRVRAHAKSQGWKLNQYGLYIATGPSAGQPVRGSRSIKTEADLAKFLGVSVRAPKNRSR